MNSTPKNFKLHANAIWRNARGIVGVTQDVYSSEQQARDALQEEFVAWPALHTDGKAIGFMYEEGIEVDDTTLLLKE